MTRIKSWTSACSVPGRLAAALGITALLSLTGCPKLQGERANAALPDPHDTAEAAIAEYDTNADGTLSQEEYSKSPGLLVASKRMDADGNGQISQDEIVEYLEMYEEAGLTLKSMTVYVTMDGAPLEGATVTLVPDSIQGEGTKPATGVTDASGRCDPMAEGVGYPAVQIGVYRVTVSQKDGGTETIPAKYNAETELGVEVSSQASDELDQGITFELFSR
ncbi:MAG: hypothetical protein KDA63_13950 [Planctomycetales bacterium]|nr:hypothetical protein [Planctomycetales bacterium]